MANQTINFDAATEIAAPIADAAMAAGDHETLDVLDEYAHIFRTTIENINADEDAGILHPDDADQLRVQAIEDYEDMLAGFTGVDMGEQDTEDNAYYSSNSTLANFSAGNDFGAALLELAEEEFENPDDAIYAIAEHTGYEPEHILGLISGEYVPDEQLAEEIAQVFETTASDSDAYNGFLTLGQEARAQEGLDYEEMDVPMEEAEDVESEKSEEFSRYLADKDHRIQELEAQFAQSQNERYVTEQLMELEQLASSGIQEGWLPPVAYREIFASFKTDQDKLAAFSLVCEGNKVNVETELYATRKALSLFERCGPLLAFGANVEEQLTPEEEDEAEEIYAQARRNVEMRQLRTGRIRSENKSE